MRRIYQSAVDDHFANGREAVFLSGARQVGKTTIAARCAENYNTSAYMNWDNRIDRQNILAHNIPFLEARYLEAPLIIFDEIHKYREWKTFLKGLIDHHSNSIDFMVTGSARLQTYRRGGDSMMGRYFLYQVHPLSVAEIQSSTIGDSEIKHPTEIPQNAWESLIRFGGFPRPFLTAQQRFYNKWMNQRLERLFHEDIRDILQSHEIAKMEVLAHILGHQSGQIANYTSLSNKVQVSDKTIRSWITTLESLYYCFTMRPYSHNVARSLLKDPKVYLLDWSTIQDKGQRYETMVASHLLKAVHFWQDMGFGQYDLYFMRDQDKREVDFLITKNQKPWILMEVKSSGRERISPHLLHFQKQVQADYVFQVAMEDDYVDIDCFTHSGPIIVSGKTLLSQLV